MGRAYSLNGGETFLSSLGSHLHVRSPRLPLSAMGPLSVTGHSQDTIHCVSFPTGPSQGVDPCASLHVWSPRLPPSQGTVHYASFSTSPSQGVDPCVSLPTVITKPLADIALLDEVLRFQKSTLPPSCSSWGERSSSSSTPS